MSEHVIREWIRLLNMLAMIAVLHQVTDKAVSRSRGGCKEVFGEAGRGGAGGGGAEGRAGGKLGIRLLITWRVSMHGMGVPSQLSPACRQTTLHY